MSTSAERRAAERAARRALIANFQRGMVGDDDGYPPTGSWAACCAQRILDAPLAHIDALVQAGVLHVFGTDLRPGDRRYSIVHPEEQHKHDWRILGQGSIICVSGGHEGSVHKNIPYITPADLPKYEGKVPS